MALPAVTSSDGGACGRSMYVRINARLYEDRIVNIIMWHIDTITEGLETLNVTSSLQYCFVYKRGSTQIEGSFRVIAHH